MNETDNNVILRWKDELKFCMDLISEVLRSRNIYNKVVEIIQSNPKINYGNRHHSWMKRNYEHATLMALRRLTDHNNRTLSLKRLIDEISKHHELLNRSWFVNMDEYKHLPLDTKNRTFDRMVGEGNDVYPIDEIKKDKKFINKAKSLIKEFINKRIAHHENVEKIEKIPSYDELDEIIDGFEEIIIKYWMLLTGEYHDGLVPHVQYDWLDIFKVPWIEQ